MKVLVLDTIHGGKEIGSAFASAGLTVDTVDVYQNSSAVDVHTASMKSYDLVVAPVHLDPRHTLLRAQKAPVISHHEAVRMLLAGDVPHPMVEITGAQGKTTTAEALASAMVGCGILQSSRGLFRYPGEEIISRLSITPASVLPAAKAAAEIGGWLIAEESLGVTGAGHLAILTSDKTYRIAAGSRDARGQKIQSLRFCRQVLLAPGIVCDLPGAIHAEDAADLDGITCRITTEHRTGSFSNSLLAREEFRIPLVLAGTAACMLGLDPSVLSDFRGVEGRMSVRKEGGIVIVDNANSGTNRETTIAAARLAREESGNPAITLVIGIEEGKVCEGFPEDEIADTVIRIQPEQVVIVGDVVRPSLLPPGIRICTAPSLGEARDAAMGSAGHGSVVLAVKTWR